MAKKNYTISLTEEVAEKAKTCLKDMSGGSMSFSAFINFQLKQFIELYEGSMSDKLPSEMTLKEGLEWLGKCVSMVD